MPGLVPASLTERNAEIERRYEGATALAREYGVSRNRIYFIVRRERRRAEGRAS